MKKLIILLMAFGGAVVSTNAYAWGSEVGFVLDNPAPHFSLIDPAAPDGIVINPGVSQWPQHWEQYTFGHDRLVGTHNGDRTNIYFRKKGYALSKANCSFGIWDWRSGTAFSTTDHWCVIAKGTQCYVDGSFNLHFTREGAFRETVAGNCQ